LNVACVFPGQVYDGQPVAIQENFTKCSDLDAGFPCNKAYFRNFLSATIKSSSRGVESEMKVTLLMALTADGLIGKDDAHLTDWTAAEDKKLFKSFTQKAGVVIMGSKTFDTLDRPLPGRKVVILTRKKNRAAPWDNVTFTNLPPGELLESLEKEGHQHAVVSGGATINALFARHGLIDEIILTYSPTIFGSGVPLFANEVSMNLSLEKVRRMGENMIYAHYKVIA